MLTALSLFSGVGGLDLAVAEAFGAHPVAFAEVEANPAKVLAARWPEVPNLGDVTAVAWEEWAGKVGVLHGGPPCQPTSSAGKRKGESDDRWMWPAALDAMRRVRPRWVVWENPSALLGLDDGEPFGRILGEMAAMGYVGSFGCLRASDVGACHGRDRLFIVASDAENKRHERVGGARRQWTGPADHGGQAAPDADGEGRRHTGYAGRELPPSEWSPGRPSRDDQGAPADAAGGRGEGIPQLDGESARTIHSTRRRHADGLGDIAWDDYAPAIARHERLTGRPAPAPVDDRGRLSARFVEWMQCFPEGWVCDVLPRNPALKALGNAVVPPQAVAAMRLLLARCAVGAAA